MDCDLLNGESDISTTKRLSQSKERFIRGKLQPKDFIQLPQTQNQRCLWLTKINNTKTFEFTMWLLQERAMCGCNNKYYVTCIFALYIMADCDLYSGKILARCPADSTEETEMTWSSVAIAHMWYELRIDFISPAVCMSSQNMKTERNN